MSNFAEELSAAVADASDRPAVKLDDVVLTYEALDQAVARAAGLLRSKGVEPGHRVGMQLPNVPYFPIVYFGALRIGAVVVTMNPLLKAREVAYYMNDSDARLLVAWPDFADAARGGADEAGAECVLATPGEFEQLLGGAQPPRARALRHQLAEALHLGRRGDPGRGAARLRRGVRSEDPRGLRPVRDDRDGVVQPAGPRA